MAGLGEECLGFLHWAIVYKLALGEQHQAIKELDDGTARLVNGHHDSAASVSRHLLQELNNPQRRRAVKARSWFVEEEELRLCQEFCGNGDSPSLTSRDSSVENVSNFGISNVGKSELFHHFFNLRGNVRTGP